jgi:hypothetical protein
MNTTHRLWSLTKLCIAGVVLVSPMPAQTVLRSIPDLWQRIPGGLTRGRFHWIDDLDGDGVTDFVVGQPFLNSSEGLVRVHSGKDAHVLFSHPGTRNSGLGLALVVPGDLNGDGITDYIGSSDFEGFAWSGADGTELARLGRFLASEPLGDCDGDGLPEFVAGWTPFPGTGHVSVFEGLQELYRLTGPPGEILYGVEVSSLGDVDGDGCGDFAVGAPGIARDDVCTLGGVWVHSGRDGRLLYHLEGMVHSEFGRSIASPGDLTGDGIPDLVVAAPTWGARHCVDVGQGRIRFYDGPTGTWLGDFDPPQVPMAVFGSVAMDLTEVGDLNGNGFGDIACWFLAVWPNPSGSQRHIMAVDGGARDAIYVVASQPTCTAYGDNIFPAGDENRDGFPEFTSSLACGSLGGRLDILSGAPIGVKAVGEPCVDKTAPRPRIGASGVPKLGTTFTLYLSEITPRQRAVLVLGSSLSKRESRPGSCGLLVQAQQFIPATPTAVRAGEGVARVDLALPNDATLIGTPFYAQWLVAPSSARAATAGGQRWTTTRALAVHMQ